MKWSILFRNTNVGSAHLELFFGFSIPMFMNELISVFWVSSCVLGIAWCGMALLLLEHVYVASNILHVLLVIVILNNVYYYLGILRY